jgi:LacI family transcriptional regulator
MTRSHQIARQIEEELVRGQHGRAYERFMTVRQLAARHGTSLVTAQKVVRQLKQQGLLIADSTNPAMISPKACRRATGGEDGLPRRLGMVITNIANPFFSRLCRHVQQAAAASGCQVLMAGSQYDFQREKKALEGFLEIGVEGLLIVPGLDEACARLYRHLVDRGLRLVFLSRQVEKVAADFVVADSFAGSAAVAGHFLSMGYQTFGYIGFGRRLTRDVRLSGFRSALVEEGATLDDELIARGDGGSVENGYSAMARLMRGAVRPRAVFAFHDLLAIGALRYCQEHRLAVPDDVAIAGFDNLPECRVTSPPLSSVGYPVESMARLAVQCLLEDRTGGPASRPRHRILLEPHLVVRRSTDPQAPEPEQPSAAGVESYEVL